MSKKEKGKEPTYIPLTKLKELKEEIEKEEASRGERILAKEAETSGIETPLIHVGSRNQQEWKEIDVSDAEQISEKQTSSSKLPNGGSVEIDHDYVESAAFQKWLKENVRG